MIYAGIDCGKTGAIAFIHPDGALKIFDTPTFKTGVGGKCDYDIGAMADLLEYAGDEARTDPFELRVAIERQQAFPGSTNDEGVFVKQGVATTFQIGYGYGIWLGILGALRIPYDIVSPRTWKAKMMPDMPKGKESSVIRAKQIFPNSGALLSRKKDHNRAESLLICEWLRTKGRQGSDLPPPSDDDGEDGSQDLDDSAAASARETDAYDKKYPGQIPF